MPVGPMQFQMQSAADDAAKCMQIAKMKWEKYARQTKQTRHMMHSACNGTMQSIQYRTAYGDELALSLAFHF